MWKFAKLHSFANIIKNKGVVCVLMQSISLHILIFLRLLLTKVANLEWKILSLKAPKCTKSYIVFTKIPGGDTPGPPSAGGTVPKPPGEGQLGALPPDPRKGGGRDGIGRG
jgi:hypothetical protein